MEGRKSHTFFYTNSLFSFLGRERERKRKGDICIQCSFLPTSMAFSSSSSSSSSSSFSVSKEGEKKLPFFQEKEAKSVSTPSSSSPDICQEKSRRRGGRRREREFLPLFFREFECGKEGILFLLSLSLSAPTFNSGDSRVVMRRRREGKKSFKKIQKVGSLPLSSTIVESLSPPPFFLF